MNIKEQIRDEIEVCWENPELIPYADAYPGRNNKGVFTIWQTVDG